VHRCSKPTLMAPARPHARAADGPETACVRSACGGTTPRWWFWPRPCHSGLGFIGPYVRDDERRSQRRDIIRQAGEVGIHGRDRIMNCSAVVPFSALARKRPDGVRCKLPVCAGLRVVPATHDMPASSSYALLDTNHPQTAADTGGLQGSLEPRKPAPWAEVRATRAFRSGTASRERTISSALSTTVSFCG
jgi:hypothetical protein